MALASALRGRLIDAIAPSACRASAVPLVSRCLGGGAASLRTASAPSSPVAYSQRQQRRGGIFASASAVGAGADGGAAARGPFQAVHEEVRLQFESRARGSARRNISAAQLVEVLFEVGVVDRKTWTVGEVMDRLMQHGFYRQSHPCKRDSYGAAPVPVLGLYECQRWATLFLSERLKETSRGDSGGSSARAPTGDHAGREKWVAKKFCRATWCQCPAAGQRFAAHPGNCALERLAWEEKEAAQGRSVA